LLSSSPPPGFANLLEGLAREVLRSQPVDIPSFAAKYFETLLIERENWWDGEKKMHWKSEGAEKTCSSFPSWPFGVQVQSAWLAL
uniref:RIIa domain-containing protein n=1 Tax=Podarcis muralis TaxID=64176 RepID=A0A670JN76_PODMU